MKRFLESIAWAPEDGTGAAQPAGASETDLVTEQPPAQQQQQQEPGKEPSRSEQARAKGLFPAQQVEGKNEEQQPPTLENGRPEGLPDKFWNAKEGAVNVDALAKSYTDLEKELGALKRAKSVGGEVPENEADYFKDPIKLPDTVTNAKLEPDDPGLKAWAAACRKHGIGKDLARTLAVDMFVSMNDFIPAPIDPEQERRELGKEGPAMADGLWAWAENLETRGGLSGDDVDIFEGLMGTAKGMRFLAKMRGMTGLEPIPTSLGNGQAAMSPAEWQTAYSKAIKEKDYAKQAELDAIGERINGTHAAGTSRSGSIGYVG
jgi:hypothetical protein